MKTCDESFIRVSLILIFVAPLNIFVFYCFNFVQTDFGPNTLPLRVLKVNCAVLVGLDGINFTDFFLAYKILNNLFEK